MSRVSFCIYIRKLFDNSGNCGSTLFYSGMLYWLSPWCKCVLAYRCFCGTLLEALESPSTDFCLLINCCQSCQDSTWQSAVSVTWHENRNRHRNFPRYTYVTDEHKRKTQAGFTQSSFPSKPRGLGIRHTLEVALSTETGEKQRTLTLAKEAVEAPSLEVFSKQADVTFGDVV